MFSIIKDSVKTHLAIAKSIGRNPKFWLILATDIMLLVAALYFSYIIRFEGVSANQNWQVQFFFTLPLIVALKIPVFYCFGLYRGMWRYTSTEDLVNILKAVIVAVVIVVVFLLYINRFAGLSRSVFILDTVFSFLFIVGHRVAIRFLYNGTNGSRRFFVRPTIPLQQKRLLLIGAGDAAEKVLRELKSNPNTFYQPVGLVDDDTRKIGLKIHGIPVIGIVDDIEDHIERMRIDEVLISIASADQRDMKRFVDLCQTTKIPFKVIPGLTEILNGKISINSIRDISYRDLLGRAEVRLEQGKIGSYLKDKIVLVTGAGGTIGSELCRQILQFSPKLMVLFDAGEENLYSIQMELEHEHNYHNIVPVLGKVQDQGLLDLVFRKYQPSVVFHAAAYKHVPLVEKNPWQAIHNNVFAAQLLIETSIIYGVHRFVLVSTDKAVRPTNVMGASKRLTELLMLAYGRNTWDGSFCPARIKLSQNSSLADNQKTLPSTHNTIFMAVRFGNVLGSSGSVIPLFKRQIANGGPVTVTHPEITRYFMSIEEAAQLILQAGTMGQGEEIFILKMGEPIKIVQMARDLIKLAGREPDSEIEIKFTGLRAGEKLYEELITEGEGIVETGHEKIMVLRGNGQTCADLFNGLEQLKQKTRLHDGSGIKEILKKLIVEYSPDYIATVI